MEETGNVEEKVLFVEPIDEIDLEVCEKIFVVANGDIDDHNIGIQYNVTEKLQAKGIKVKKLTLERKGEQIRGDFIRYEVFIEPTEVKQIRGDNLWNFKVLAFAMPIAEGSFLPPPWVEVFGPKYSKSTSSHHPVALPLTCV